MPCAGTCSSCEPTTIIKREEASKWTLFSTCGFFIFVHKLYFFTFHHSLFT